MHYARRYHTHNASRTFKGATFLVYISYNSHIFRSIVFDHITSPILPYLRNTRKMRLDILAACMFAYASSSLAAPPPTNPPKGGACLAPSQPDRKVNAYPSKHLAPVKAIAPPEPPKGPEAPDMHQQEHRGPTIILPVLHRKIIMHDEIQNIDA